MPEGPRPAAPPALTARPTPPPPVRADEPRTRRRVLATAAILILVLGAAAALTLPQLDRTEEPGTPATTAAAPQAVGEQQTLLLVRLADDGSAAGVTLLGAGPAEDDGVAVLVPVGTLVEIPGVGLDRLGLAQQYGGADLVAATVENLLGIAIDHVGAVDTTGLGALLDRTGGLSIDVPERLAMRNDDGSAEVRFEAGSQQLDGPRLAEYWSFIGPGEDELASFPRQQQVLTGLFDALGAPEVLDSFAGGGIPELDTAAEPDWLRTLFAGLATAGQGDGVDVVLLPVESFGGEGPQGDATYRPREEAVAQLVDQHLAASVPADGGADAVRVQVLNGVGVPGVGQIVDERLGEGPFRIVLTDNARSFDFTETQILVYDESERSLAAARQVQERLGVGTIQVSRQPQSVVDLTIVVGADLIADQPGDEQT